MVRGKALASLAVATLFAVSAWGMDANTQERTGVPGALNYVEGSASIGNETLNSKSIGATQLEAGQSLSTQNGKAELLLTPGVFLRLGDDSTVKMVNPSITNTQVELGQGHAIIEVDEIHPENDIRIAADGSTTRLLKTGLYDFNLRQSRLMVFDGKAAVVEGDGHAEVKGGHEIALDNTSGKKLKTYKFNKKQNEDSDLYRWSSLRSSYLAEANVDASAMYANGGVGPWGPGWWGADWYWDPWFDAFTFIPGDGIFWSPFGWGFYSPWWVTTAPYYGWGGYGYGHRPFYHHFSSNYHNWGPGQHYVGSAGYNHGIYHGAGSAGAFHSGPRMMMGGGGRGFGRGGIRGGGIRGGGMRGAGGFHSGGFGGGGFHGGGFHGGVGFHGGGGFHGR
jgi:hypothetical protein